ncbi:HTH_Tnp_Tc3_2 domain-containing protein [Trichonephila clavipes]|nr:HTH_Tnp_Tc3_2 domain-containing protein [Trichonephila clavipes]
MLMLLKIGGGLESKRKKFVGWQRIDGCSPTMELWLSMPAAIYWTIPALVFLLSNSSAFGNHQMARIVCHNDESVSEGYIRNGGKEVKLFTIALKAFQCNNRIVMEQRKHLEDFLRGRIIGLLKCGPTQLKVSEKLGIAQTIISRLWQRFQDDVTAKRNKRSKASDLSHQLSSATSTTVSRQTVYRHLGHIGLYARRPVRCVLLTATHCRLRLTWNRKHALWTPQQWSCVMFSDEYKFSVLSDSRQTLIWRVPGIRYHQ